MGSLLRDTKTATKALGINQRILIYVIQESGLAEWYLFVSMYNGQEWLLKHLKYMYQFLNVHCMEKE